MCLTHTTDKFAHARIKEINEYCRQHLFILHSELLKVTGNSEFCSYLIMERGSNPKARKERQHKKVEIQCMRSTYCGFDFSLGDLELITNSICRVLRQDLNK